jgi:hypothetical protein
MNVGIVIFPEVEELDFVGPWGNNQHVECAC